MITPKELADLPLADLATFMWKFREEFWAKAAAERQVNHSELAFKLETVAICFREAAEELDEAAEIRYEVNGATNEP